MQKRMYFAEKIAHQLGVSLDLRQHHTSFSNTFLFLNLRTEMGNRNIVRNNEDMVCSFSLKMPLSSFFRIFLNFFFGFVFF